MDWELTTITFQAFTKILNRDLLSSEINESFIVELYSR